MNPDALRASVVRQWQDDILPSLMDFIRIPALSPLFDADWEANGHIEAAVRLAAGWSRARPIRGLTVEVLRLPGRTPVLWVEMPGTAEGTVLLYGHLDKQPEMVGWRDDLGPWTPVVEDGRLYGRGSVDDGYALYAALAAVQALEEQGLPRARCVALIECSEESGSHDLPAYLDAYRERIGDVSLAVVLDSGCGDYERLWCTVSLRGILNGALTVEMLSEGVHSGDASGIVPSTFRIARQLLSRLEDEDNGAILLSACHAPVPEHRAAELAHAAEVLGAGVEGKYPFLPGAHPLPGDRADWLVNRAWRPMLGITGADGLPPVARAGNVLRPATALKLSLRLPPTCDAAAAAAAVKDLLERDPPYGARVRFTVEQAAPGWNAAPAAPWFKAALERGSARHFGQPAVFMGEGVSIPVLEMLGTRYPAAQFLVTGALGPGSNAHGPNEFLHLHAARALTCCVAEVIAAHGAEHAA